MEHQMRLPDFIREHVEPILAAWERFARDIWPGEAPAPIELRDDAEALLQAIVVDMQSAQTWSEQANKSQGRGSGGTSSNRVDNISTRHAIGRVASGFELTAVL